MRPAQIEEQTRDVFRGLAPHRASISAMDAEIVAAQLTIAQMASPTGAEHERAAWVSRRLSGYGYDVRSDAAGNVIARSAESRVTSHESPVVVAAHLDTVFPPGTALTVERSLARLSCPGICDNARGLAAMLAIARVLAAPARGAVRPVEFVATTGEEGNGDLRGAKQYVANAVTPFAFVALDGAGDERIVNAGLGSRRFRVEFRGPGGHSWNAFGTANPIHATARAASAFANLRLATGSALTVSRIGGGLSVNSIPGEAWVEVDVRGTREATLARLEAELRDAAAAAVDDENQRATRGTVELTVTCIGARPAGETSEDSAVVQAALAATRIIDRTPALATASTDANAAMAVGAPAISIGGGGKGGDTHSTNEWYENADASAGVQRALAVVATLAQLRE